MEFQNTLTKIRNDKTIFENQILYSHYLLQDDSISCNVNPG